VTNRTEITAENRYRVQGAKAFKDNQPRESCRYKAADIVREWQAGWDDAKAKRDEAKRAAAVPRWEEYGSRGWGPDRTPPTEYHLKGDAPRLSVHHKQYEDQAEWFVSCHDFGIEGEPLNTREAHRAKKLAVVRVRGIMHERLAQLAGIAEVDGTLLSEVAR
jgi:ribosome modulation factor